jgi:hypothetical protein
MFHHTRHVRVAPMQTKAKRSKAKQNSIEDCDLAPLVWGNVTPVATLTKAGAPLG